VLRHAIESGGSSHETPVPGLSRLVPLLAMTALGVGSVSQIRLVDVDTTDGDGDLDVDSESDPALRPGSSEIPAAPGDAAHLELLGEIARGAMGAILKGRDPGLGRDLAVKVLLESHKDKPDLARRFIEEAQIAGQLQHPGVVPVYELGAFADSRPYFSMKLVKGRTLAALLAERGGPPPVGRGSPAPAPGSTGGLPDRIGPGRARRGDLRSGPRRGRETRAEPRADRGGPRLVVGAGSVRRPHRAGRDRGTEPPPTADRPPDDLPRLVAIFEQVCRTMAYAHTRGVIHRDLKPSNVMVGGFGEVQVMDWGLAKVLASGGVADESRAIRRQDGASVVRTVRTGSDADASQAGSVMGTPAYMPPEQAGGDVEALDERADVFGLGAILCEVLTGSPAYVGRDGNEVLRKAQRGDLADAFARLDACGADGELVALAKACLAPELLDRPRDARVVSERLTEHLAGVQDRLRAAELARAAEAARAIEAVRKARAERRARRLAAGLAAAIFVAMALGGGGAAWVVSVRNARRAAAVGEAEDLLGRVVVLKARAHAAPPGEVAPWKEALAEAARAAERVRELADPERADRLARDVDELERGRRAAEVQAARLEVDHKLLAELEAVRGALAEYADPRRTDHDYADAFRKAGLDLDSVDPDQAGAWIAARSAPLELALFLDDWATVRQRAGSGEPAWRRLVAAARAADKDPWRDALRTGRGSEGPESLAALHKLAGNEAALATQPAEGLRLLASRLKAAGDPEAAAQVLRRAWRRRPDDFWVHFDLAHAPGRGGSGSVEELSPSPEEAVRHLTAALAVRPRGALAHNNLGIALRVQGELAEAVAEYREAIRLQPDNASVHSNLGNALREQGKLAEAVAECREAIRLKPGYAEAHNNLGIALRVQGKPAEAVAQFREAIRLKPGYAEPHTNLGIALHGQGELAEAIAEHREAIRLKPDLAFAHSNLGYALEFQGNLAEAVAECREAIRLKPDHVVAHSNLAWALESQGDLDGALAELRAARDRAGPEPERRLPGIGLRVAAVERKVRLRDRLADVLTGRDRPSGPAEGVEFAVLAYQRGAHAPAARLYAQALAADPKLADDRAAQHRYNAACVAALAGCGQGRDDPPLDEAARADLRKQALGWLRAELAAWVRTLDAADPTSRAGVARTLQHWKKDSDLAGVRDPEALARLPEVERKEWPSLWADVDRLLQRAGGGQP
jgi:serine/threonine-protein kinase